MLFETRMASLTDYRGMTPFFVSQNLYSAKHG